MKGFGGFHQVVVQRQPTHRVCGKFSGNGSTVGNVPNRVSGALTVAALTQSTAADKPLIDSVGSVAIVHFDGSAHDLKTTAAADILALRHMTGPSNYWAWHVRIFPQSGAARTLWSEWGSTERFQVSSDATSITVSVATSAIAFASATFPLSTATQRAGMWLEVFYDGTLASASDRIRLSVNGSPVTASSFTGTLPQAMLTGNATAAWLGSLNGSSNLRMQVAHFWVCKGIPTAAERAALRAFEEPTWGSLVLSSPLDLPNLTCWLRVSLSTRDVNGVSSIPDALNGANPAVQTVQARRPGYGTTATGMGYLDYPTEKSLTWPLTTANNGLVETGFAFWMKMTAWNWSRMINAPGKLYANMTAGGSLQFGVISGFDAGKNTNMGGMSTSQWHFVTCEYDGAGSADADRLVVSFDGFVRAPVITGVGTTLAVLPTATGPIIIGNTHDGAGTQPFFGQLGDIYCFSKGAGVTQGLLSPTRRLELMNYNPPV